ncbi:MAG: amidohydrolase family protein [Chloroflexota bacterium]|nr:amidohydrolase family protein [Chloroflexota bacterium]
MKIIDSHVYVGEYLFGEGVEVSELLQAMDDSEVDQVILIPNRPKAYALEPASQLVFDLTRQHPDRFLSHCRVDPWQGDSAMDLLKKGHQTYGARSLLLHPWEEHFNVALPLVDPFVAYAAENNMAVMIEAGYSLMSHPLDIAELARRHPSARVIATHGLQLDSSAFALSDASLAMAECPNIFMGTAGMYAFEVMENVVNTYGAERLIFGSHYPWFNLALEKYRVERLNISNEQREAIFCKNIEQLLNLS